MIGDGFGAVIDEEHKSRGQEAKADKAKQKSDHKRAGLRDGPKAILAGCRDWSHYPPGPACSMRLPGGAFLHHSLAAMRPASSRGSLSIRPPGSLKFHSLSRIAAPANINRKLKWLPKTAARHSGRPLPTRKRCCFTAKAGPGKLEVVATKPMATQRDLSLAYSPGVAVPVLAIAEDESQRLRLHRQRQFRRGDHQWHRDPRSRQSSARWQRSR